MRGLDSERRGRWKRRAWIALTVVAVCVMMAKPELRVLAPLMDAVGLDVIIVLFGVQLLLGWRWMFFRFIRPGLHVVSHSIGALDCWTLRVPIINASRHIASALLLRLGGAGLAAWLGIAWVSAALRQA
jgi:hypothetical protein